MVRECALKLAITDCGGNLQCVELAVHFKCIKCRCPFKEHIVYIHYIASQLGVKKSYYFFHHTTIIMQSCYQKRKANVKQRRQRTCLNMRKATMLQHRTRHWSFHSMRIRIFTRSATKVLRLCFTSMQHLLPTLPHLN